MLELVAEVDIVLDTAVETTRQEGQRATRMGEEQLQVGHFVQHAGANQARDLPRVACEQAARLAWCSHTHASITAYSSGGLEGESESEEQRVAVVPEMLVANAIVRMDEYHVAKRLDFLPHGQQLRVVEPTASHTRTHERTEAHTEAHTEGWPISKVGSCRAPTDVQATTVGAQNYTAQLV